MSAQSRFQAAQLLSQGIMGAGRAVSEGIRERSRKKEEAPLKKLQFETADLQKALTEQRLNIGDLEIAAKEAKTTEDAEVKEKIKNFLQLVNDPIMKEKVLDRPEFKQALMKSIGGADSGPTQQPQQTGEAVAPVPTPTPQPRSLTPTQKLQKAQEVGLTQFENRPDVKSLLSPIREDQKFTRGEESGIAKEERAFDRSKELLQLRGDQQAALQNIRRQDTKLATIQKALDKKIEKKEAKQGAKDSFGGVFAVYDEIGKFVNPSGGLLGNVQKGASAVKQFFGAEDPIGTLKMYNGILKNQAARVLGGEKGVMTDKDIKRFDSLEYKPTDTEGQRKIKRQAYLLFMDTNNSPADIREKMGKLVIELFGKDDEPKDGARDYGEEYKF